MHRLRSIAIIGLTLLSTSTAGARYAAAEERDPLADLAAKVTVENSNRQDSLSLLMAAGKALGEGRVEEAGFFYHAGQIRGRIDLEVFDPVGEGGNSPGVLLAAMEVELGFRINPIVMRDRDAFARIVSRVAKWAPNFDDGYQPGWEYAAVLSGPQREAAVTEVMEPWVTQMQAFNQLLQHAEYYRLFKTFQNYSPVASDALEQFAQRFPLAEKPAAATEAEYEAAIARMKQIEKALGLESGLFADEEEERRSRKPDYKIQDGKVRYQRVEVPSADPATFEVLADVEYAKDAKHVYVTGREIRGADPKTFQVIKGPYARDKSAIYCGNIRMDVGRIETFQVVSSTGFWRIGEVEIIGYAWARDGQNWYYGPDVVAGADYDSLQPIDGFYAEDKYREYDGLHPMEKGSIPAWARDRLP